MDGRVWFGRVGKKAADYLVSIVSKNILRHVCELILIEVENHLGFQADSQFGLSNSVVSLTVDFVLHQFEQ